MVLAEHEILLKNGKIVVLKTPALGDGANMLQFIKTACGETDFLLRYPEEWEIVSVENEEKWIEGSRKSPNLLMAACYIDGEIVGNCEIRFMTGKKTGHRASLAIAILKKYWNLGIGSAMFEILISAAKAHEGTEIVELEFIEGNDRAKVLYEKFGFQVVCELPDAFKLRDGKMVKQIFMQKRL